MDYKAFLRPGAGAADISPLLRDGRAFHQCIEDLAAPFRLAAIDKVACIEGRGFLFGASVAYALSVGVVPVRHLGRLKTARATYHVQFVDYSGTHKTLEIHADGIAPADRVLIVDDWVETAATVRATIHLVESCGGIVAGVSVLMDDTDAATRADLASHGYRFLARTAEGDPF